MNEHEEAVARLLATLQHEAVGLGPSKTLSILEILKAPPEDAWDWPFIEFDFGTVIEQIVPTVSFGLFYPATVNMLHGPSGVGKSMLAQHAAWLEVVKGHHVVWIDYENTNPEELIARRFQAQLSIFDRERLNKFFHVIGANERSMQVNTGALLKRIQDLDAALVVVDSLGEAIAADDLDENRDLDMARWMRHVARRLVTTGAAICIIDHATKANEYGLFAAGSKRKRAAVTGISWAVGDEDDQLFSVGHSGSLTLKVGKDRHGYYQQNEAAFRFIITAEPGIDILNQGRFELALQRLVPGETSTEHTKTVVENQSWDDIFRDVLGTDPGLGKKALLGRVRLRKPGSTPKLEDQLIRLMSEGKIKLEQVGAKHHYYWFTMDLP